MCIVQRPYCTPIEHFWLMQMLGNLEAKRKYILYFLLLFLFKNRSRATKRSWYLSTLQNNFSNFQKLLEYCPQHNVLHYECYHSQKKFLARPIYFSFSKFSNRQNMFWSRNLSSNMPEITSFSLKIVKIAQRWRLCPQTPYASGS